MKSLVFYKYEGLGNDFLLVEADHATLVSPALARAMCERRRGAGADGVLLVNGVDGKPTMRVLNADGSTPEMCGNGLRCVALHLARARGLSTLDLLVETDAGPRSCLVDDRDGAGIVTVDMGFVRTGEDVRVDLDGDPWELSLADAGNPHAITTRKVSRATIDLVGHRLATAPRFAQGTNVEFASFGPTGIDLIVWERGVGITEACGTGACATVAVGVAKGWIAKDREVDVRLPGGTLSVTYRNDGHAVMRGPARKVFTGEWNVEGGSIQ